MISRLCSCFRDERVFITISSALFVFIFLCSTTDFGNSSRSLILEMNQVKSISRENIMTNQKMLDIQVLRNNTATATGTGKVDPSRKSFGMQSFFKTHGTRLCMIPDVEKGVRQMVQFIKEGVGLKPSAIASYSMLHYEISNKLRSPNNFIYTACIGGFGNCLHGVVTALMIGLLTNRALLVDWKFPVKSCFIDWDFDKSILIPENITTQFGYYDTCFDATDDTKRFESMKWNEFKDYFGGLSSGDPFKFLTNCPIFKYFAKNPHIQSKLNELGILDPLVSSKFSQSVLAESQTGLTPGFLAFGSILRSFFSLDFVNFFKFKKMIKPIGDNLYIGLHIRMGGSYTKGYTDPVYTPPEVLPDIWKCAKQVANYLASPRVYFFVCSDGDEIVKEAKKVLGEEFVLTSDGESFHAESGQGLDKTVIDFWALSNADVLIVTPGSTFGSTAAMVHGRRPFYVDYNTHECKLTDLNNPPLRYQTKFPAY